MNMSVELDIVIGTNNYLQIQVESSSLSPYGISTVIYQIPSSFTVIQNTTINEYINPPTSQMTYLSLRGGLTTTFVNEGVNPWRMTLAAGSYPSIMGGNIGIVYSPNTSTPAYISVAKTALYDVSIVHNRTFTGTGTTTGSFFINFWNITQGTQIG